LAPEVDADGPSGGEYRHGRDMAMRGRRAVKLGAAGAFWLCLVVGGPLSASAQGEVRALLFHLEDCDHCRVVREEVIPTVQSSFPLEVREVDASGLENSWILLAFQRSHGVAEGQVPALAIGTVFLQGEQEIREKLLGIVLDLAGRGGADWPAIPEGAGGVSLPALPSSDTCGSARSPSDGCGSGTAPLQPPSEAPKSPEVR
jgi:hypothetical protein